MSDADGDSTMNSSPELDAQDDEMFPDEAAGPSTPRQHAAFGHDLASELSPPNSQGPSGLVSREDEGLPLAGNGSPSLLNQNGKRVRGGLLGLLDKDGDGGKMQSDPETGYRWSKQEDQPGYEWKNQRAREEEARALENIVDKKDQIRTRYGDPLDPSVKAK
ncbi:hypothetical protein EJ04DRAFT_572670 [Polyplosphaeria fusca]|uniref:Uncharacterized protein n=1 Tax=Polyplosphaeria fusca TaxID=682080 RepID=A0A9P4R8A5_9PLEO|nr:hypothetical protein EJ04DRAFT_572670 [Polyplosphaeria fusca]